jgi:hypothetical protein
VKSHKPCCDTTVDHHLTRQGQVILGDKGFAGRDFEEFIRTSLGCKLLGPDRKTNPRETANSPEHANGSKPSSAP